MDYVLVTGAFSQIGTELTRALRDRHGRSVSGAGSSSYIGGPRAVLDVTHLEEIVDVICAHEIDVIYHLTARLSAVSEDDPQLAWSVNMSGSTTCWKWHV